MYLKQIFHPLCKKVGKQGENTCCEASPKAKAVYFIHRQSHRGQGSGVESALMAAPHHFTRSEGFICKTQAHMGQRMKLSLACQCIQVLTSR